MATQIQPNKSAGNSNGTALAKTDDSKIIAEMRNRFATDPTSLARVTDDMRTFSVGRFINRMSGNDAVIEEMYLQTAARMRADLCGPNFSATERLLAEHIVLCWLAVQAAETALAHCESKSPTIQSSEFFQDRRDRTHRNYLAALKTLATVRKLALPAVQLNIAKKQVNMMNVGSTGQGAVNAGNGS